MDKEKEEISIARIRTSYHFVVLCQNFASKEDSTTRAFFRILQVRFLNVFRCVFKKVVATQVSFTDANMVIHIRENLLYLF